MSRRDKIFIALGGVLGMGVYLFLAALFDYGQLMFRSRPVVFLLGTALSGTLGCMAGLATRPFADDGFVLVRNSILHYLVTAALFAGVIVTLGGNELACIVWVGELSALYLLIWLGRWVGWYMEVMQLRSLLGLAPGPSPLKWRETLPYLPFVLLLCDGLPLAAYTMDRLLQLGPMLSGVVCPYVILPVVGFISGVSLGKRQGVCILYPVACFLCYLPMVFLIFNSSAMFHCFMVSVPALAGNLVGAGICKMRSKK